MEKSGVQMRGFTEQKSYLILVDNKLKNYATRLKC